MGGSQVIYLRTDKSMSLKKYNNILASVIWSNKYPKDSQILSLVVFAQNLANDYKNPSENTSMESTKGDPAYVRDLPPWML